MKYEKSQRTHSFRYTDFLRCLLESWLYIVKVWTNRGWKIKFGEGYSTQTLWLFYDSWKFKHRLHQSGTLQHLLIWGSIAAMRSPLWPLSLHGVLLSFPSCTTQTNGREKERERRPASFRTWPVQQMLLWPSIGWMQPSSHTAMNCGRMLCCSSCRVTSITLPLIIPIVLTPVILYLSISCLKH